MAQPTPFSNAPTENEIAYKRRLANSLMGQGMDTSPAGHWTVALARALQGGVGGYMANQAEQGQLARNQATLQTLQGNPSFAALSDADRSYVAQNPALMQSLAQGALATRLDPNARLKTDLLKAQIARSNRGPVTADPSSWREWQRFGTLSPEQKREYLLMKRAGEKYLDLGTHYSQPNSLTGEMGPRVTKDIRGKESEEEIGKAIGKFRVNQPQLERALDSYRRDNEAVAGTIDRAIKVLQQYGNSAAGWGSLKKSIPGDIALQLETDLATIAANQGFDKLQAMRDASPTGGALGQVSEFENRLLQSVQGSTDQRLPPKALIRNLMKIKQLREQAYRAKQRAYQIDLRRFGGGPQPVGAGNKPFQLPPGYSIIRE